MRGLPRRKGDEYIVYDGCREVDVVSRPSDNLICLNGLDESVKSVIYAFHDAFLSAQNLLNISAFDSRNLSSLFLQKSINAIKNLRSIFFFDRNIFVPNAQDNIIRKRHHHEVGKNSI